MNRAPEITAFYDGRSVGLPCIRPGGVGELWIPGHTASVDEDAVREQLKSSVYHVLEHNGTSVELVMFNPGNVDQGILLIVPQFSSSIGGRPNDIWYAANLAVRQQGMAVAYMSSLGNGKTSGMTREERRHFGATGMLTHDEQGARKPLPTIENIAQALLAQGYMVTRIVGSSAGSAYAKAIAAAHPHNQITHGIFDAHTRWTESSWLRMTFETLVGEEVLAACMHSIGTPDTGIADRRRRKEVKRQLAGVYENQPPFPWNLGRLAMHLMTARAHAHGLPAAWEDLRAMHASQPGMHAWFIVERRDRLQRDYLEESVRTMMRWAGESLPGFDIGAVFVDGPHDFQGLYPQMFGAIIDELLHPEGMPSVVALR